MTRGSSLAGRLDRLEASHGKEDLSRLRDAEVTAELARVREDIARALAAEYSEGAVEEYLSGGYRAEFGPCPVAVARVKELLQEALTA